MNKIILSILAIVMITSPVLAFSEAPQAPQNLEEAQSLGQKFLEGLPNVAKEGFREFIGLLKNIWFSYIMPAIRKVWSLLDQKVEEKRPAIERELQKEKEEIIQEIPKAGKSLWQRIKDLFNNNS